MEFLREIIDSSTLDKVINLPHALLNRKVEILIFPVREQEKKIHIDKEQIDELMKGSVTQSLIGAVPDSGITLNEIRSLRLRKYDSTH